MNYIILSFITFWFKLPNIIKLLTPFDVAYSISMDIIFINSSPYCFAVRILASTLSYYTLDVIFPFSITSEM